MITDDMVTSVSSGYNVNASRPEIRRILERFEALNTVPKPSEGLRPDEQYVLKDSYCDDEDEFTSKEAMYTFLSRKAKDRGWDEDDVSNFIEVYIRRKENCTLEVTKSEMAFNIR